MMDAPVRESRETWRRKFQLGWTLATDFLAALLAKNLDMGAVVFLAS